MPSPGGSPDWACKWPSKGEKEDGILLKDGRNKARAAGCSSSMSQPTVTTMLGKRAGPGQVLAARGIPSQHCSHHQCLLGLEGFVLWLLIPARGCGCFIPATQGKPQAILWFHSDTFVLSTSSCRPHSAEDILFGNFSFNSLNSSVNRQLPLLSDCLSHFLSEQSSGFTLQHFLFTFSTYSDIFPFLAEVGC